MKCTKSNQSKAFELKSALRKYSDGGYVYAPRNDGRQNSFDSTSTLPKDPTSGFTGMSSPISAAAQQNIDMYNRMSSSLRTQNQAIEGTPNYTAAPPPAAPGLPAAAPTATPAAPAMPATMVFSGGGGTKAMAAMMQKMQQAQQPKPAEDFRYKFARGGEVDGPGGPTDDKIPAMLSDGEYVLPAKTVQALGGPEALHRLVLRTNGKMPIPKMVDGVPHAADGLFDPEAWREVGKNIRGAADKGAEYAQKGYSYLRGKAPGWWGKTKDVAGAAMDKASAVVDDIELKNNRSYKAYKDFGETLRNPSKLITSGKGRMPALIEGIAELADDDTRKFFTDPNVSDQDKWDQAKRVALRVGGARVVGGVGTTLGALTAPVTGPVGAIGGALAGGYAGAEGGNWIGEKIWGDPMAKWKASQNLPSTPQQSATGRQIDKFTGSASPFANVQGGASSTAPIAGMPNFGNVQSGKSFGIPAAPKADAAAAAQMSDEERALLQEELATRVREGNMLGYAREGALRRQMVEDQENREYNPGTGIAEVMPETDRFGKTAAQRDADMERFRGSIALSRIGHGAGKRYAAAQAAAAEGFLKNADSITADEQRMINSRKEMMTGHLARQAGLRGKGAEVAADRQKTADAREASKYRDDQGLRGDNVKADAVVQAAVANAQGELGKGRLAAAAKMAEMNSEHDVKGNEAAVAALKLKYGDPDKDEGARKSIDRDLTLLAGTMAKGGYPPRLLNDPRIRMKLLSMVDTANKAKDSEKTLLSALQSFLDPTRGQLYDVNDAAAYQPRKLGPQKAFGRDVMTDAGPVSQSVLAGGGQLDFLFGRRLPKDDYYRSIRDGRLTE